MDASTELSREEKLELWRKSNGGAGQRKRPLGAWDGNVPDSSRRSTSIGLKSSTASALSENTAPAAVVPPRKSVRDSAVGVTRVRVEPTRRNTMANKPTGTAKAEPTSESAAALALEDLDVRESSLLSELNAMLESQLASAQAEAERLRGELEARAAELSDVKGAKTRAAVALAARDQEATALAAELEATKAALASAADEAAKEAAQAETRAVLERAKAAVKIEIGGLKAALKTECDARAAAEARIAAAESDAAAAKADAAAAKAASEHQLSCVQQELVQARAELSEQRAAASAAAVESLRPSLSRIEELVAAIAGRDHKDARFVQLEIAALEAGQRELKECLVAKTARIVELQAEVAALRSGAPGPSPPQQHSMSPARFRALVEVDGWTEQPPAAPQVEAPADAAAADAAAVDPEAEDLAEAVSGAVAFAELAKKHLSAASEAEVAALWEQAKRAVDESVALRFANQLLTQELEEMRGKFLVRLAEAYDQNASEETAHRAAAAEWQATLDSTIEAMQAQTLKVAQESLAKNKSLQGQLERFEAAAQWMWDTVEFDLSGAPAPVAALLTGLDA